MEYLFHIKPEMSGGETQREVGKYFLITTRFELCYLLDDLYSKINFVSPALMPPKYRPDRGGDLFGYTLPP